MYKPPWPDCTLYSMVNIRALSRRSYIGEYLHSSTKKKLLQSSSSHGDRGRKPFLTDWALNFQLSYHTNTCDRVGRQCFVRVQLRMHGFAAAICSANHSLYSWSCGHAIELNTRPIALASEPYFICSRVYPESRSSEIYSMSYIWIRVSRFFRIHFYWSTLSRQRCITSSRTRCS